MSATPPSYYRFLRLIEKNLGKDVTYDSDLTRVGRYLFGKKYLGTFPWDKRPKGSPGGSKVKGYYIVNLDKTGEPGTHWCAVADGLFYDSFGRALMPDRTDDDPEQHVLENNCGQRCLAFLCVYERHGRAVAKKI